MENKMMQQFLGALAAVENKVEYKIRCNNCMRLFQNEMELGEVEDEDYRSFYFVCPNCQTDAYLIDLT